MRDGVRLLNIIALYNSLGLERGIRAADYIRCCYVKLLGAVLLQYCYVLLYSNVDVTKLAEGLSYGERRVNSRQKCVYHVFCKNVGPVVPTL